MMISLPIWLVVVLGLGWVITLTYVYEFRALWLNAEDRVLVWQNACTEMETSVAGYRRERDSNFAGLAEDDLPPSLSLRNRTVTLPRERKEILDRMTTEAIAEGLYDRHPDYEVQPPEDNDGA